MLDVTVKMKLSFKSLKLNALSVVATHAEALGTYAPDVHCARSAKLTLVKSLPTAIILVRHGKTKTPSRCGVPYWG